MLRFKRKAMSLINVAQRVLEATPTRGKGRLAEHILRHCETETLSCHPVRGLDVHLRKSQRIERLMWAGAYEPKLVALFKRAIKPSMTILDVGANIGYFAAIAARLTEQGGSVHAFEPNPACCKCLEQNLRPFRHAHAYPLAISDADGMLPLYLSEDEQEEGWGSLLKEAGIARCTLQVPITSINTFIYRFGVPRVDLMKLDIEGNELRALRGANRIIERDHPAVVAELNMVCLARGGAKPDDVVSFLRGYGYVVHPLDSTNIYATWSGNRPI